jgi:hypothetical protein
VQRNGNGVVLEASFLKVLVGDPGILDSSGLTGRWPGSPPQGAASRRSEGELFDDPQRDRMVDPRRHRCAARGRAAEDIRRRCWSSIASQAAGEELPREGAKGSYAPRVTPGPEMLVEAVVSEIEGRLAGPSGRGSPRGWD